MKDRGGEPMGDAKATLHPSESACGGRQRPARLARAVLAGWTARGRDLREASDLADLLRSYSLTWHRRPLGRLRGALVGLGDEYHVVTNSALSTSEGRLVAAHELGHYLMHHRPQWLLCSAEAGTWERAADCFSREEDEAEEFARTLWAGVGGAIPAANCGRGA